MRTYDVFVCYSRHDANVAERICERLVKENITVFHDAFALPIDGDFASAITEIISNSRYVLYLHSEYSIQSNWVRKELEFAINKGLSVIPVNVSGFRSDNSSIRQLLYDRYWLEYDRAAYDNQEQFEKLIFNLLRIVNPAAVENSYGGTSQRPGPIKSATLPAESIKEPKGKDAKAKKTPKSNMEFIWLTVLLIIVAVLAIVSIANDNYIEAAILLVADLAAICFLVYLIRHRFAINARYTVRIHNADSRRRIVVRVNGEEYSRLEPLGMSEIERRKGEYIISAQVEDESSDAVIINHCFNKETDGKIIPISFTQEQKEIRKSDLLKYRCFIAGSTSITNERNAARAVLSILYNQYEKYDFYITAHTYEDFKNKHKIDGQQYDYDTFIREKADCTIFIICNHVGDKTLKEYDLAIETFENTDSKRPAIFVYNDVSSVNDISEQDPSVIKFRKLVESKHAYWRDYTGMDMLMLKIKDDVSAELTDVLEMRPSIGRK